MIMQTLDNPKGKTIVASGFGKSDGHDMELVNPTPKPRKCKIPRKKNSKKVQSHFKGHLYFCFNLSIF